MTENEKKIKSLLLSSDKLNHKLAAKIIIGHKLNPTDVVNLITIDDFVKYKSLGFTDTREIYGFGRGSNFAWARGDIESKNRALKRVRNKSRKYILHLIKQNK